MNTSKICNKDHSYNGWSNYETWSIALFIDNEEYYQEIVNDIIKSNKEDYDKEQDIKDFMEEQLVTDELNAYQTQLILATLSEVNYREIVKNKKGDLQ